MAYKVIDFTASWCPPCQMLKPIFAKVGEMFDDVEFVTVDVDQNPSEASSMGVQAMPTLVLLKDDVEADRIVGLPSEQSLIDAVKKLKGE